MSLLFFKMKSFPDKQKEFLIVLQLPTLCSRNQILLLKQTTHTEESCWLEDDGKCNTYTSELENEWRQIKCLCKYNIHFFICVRVCRTVKTTQRGIGVSAALRDSTVWSEVSMTTVNPAPVPSPTQRTSKLSGFKFFFGGCMSFL